MNQQVTFTRKIETEVDCIFNLDSAFCTWKKPYLKPLNTLSAEIIIDIIKAVFCSKITERLYIYFLQKTRQQEAPFQVFKH